ncbi:MAG: 1-acyl-sn-glycerol-3-phosphate acyltransferase [Gammaproteobacteria bacterium]|nr:1-acyl-sn-glycerol-3-phosphate acyltransferase [Gammaproteobacteria bacterium]MDE0453038.1 1-acyl-sn-glycerol-3-phosphate acyltransferase [Gammaproteobacteria bacterium]
MDAFDDIRPYRDDEVPAVLSRLVEDPNALRGIAGFAAPWCYRLAPGLTLAATKMGLTRQVRELDSVDSLQLALTAYFEKLIRRTTSGFTWDGVDALDPSQPHLFVSNHRDIALDSGFMNFALWQSGRKTTQIGVGDNLFTNGTAMDLMRLNKSFSIARAETGAKAQFAALMKTSCYIRSALEAEESVWIAQREGRAKDGVDQSNPALFKMFLLAYREEFRSFDEWLHRVALVPVSISYELDPCAGTKAKELYFMDRDGKYDKNEGEDIRSMAKGIFGFKGRVHVSFGARVEGAFEQAEDLADHIDRMIVGGLKTYPTQVLALDGCAELDPRVRKAFYKTLDGCPREHRKFVLMQYANQLRHKRDLARKPDLARKSPTRADRAELPELDEVRTSEMQDSASLLDS